MGDGDLSKKLRDDLESEAEEVYVPDGRQGSVFENVLGYQKYLNIVSQLAQNNSDEYEPLRPNYNNFMRVLEEEEDEDEERLRREQEELDAMEAEAAAELDEDGKRKTKFNFSGMSFAEYVKSIKESLNNEMKEIVTTFVKQKAQKHPSVHLVQRRF
jgi:glutamate synthase domain-containing protein 2